MAKTYTRLEIRDRAREEADMVNSQFVTDAKFNDWIDAGLASFYDLVVGAYGDDYFTTSDTFTVVAGQESYVLATIISSSDLYKIRQVEVQVSATRWFTLTRVPLAEQAKYRGANNSLQYGQAYILLGPDILLIPVPQGGSTARIYYVPYVANLASDSATVDGINGWEEYVVAWAARKALAKEQDWEGVAALSQELASLTERIKAMAPTRDAGSPKRVIDRRRHYSTIPIQRY